MKIKKAKEEPVSATQKADRGITELFEKNPHGASYVTYFKRRTEFAHSERRVDSSHPVEASKVPTKGSDKDGLDGCAFL